MTYQEYVDSAKRLVKQIDSYQSRIAEMAIAVCQIRHGGKSEGYYTLTDFASDTGINNKTLSEWVSIYRNIIVKAGIVNPTVNDWTNATRANTLLKNERTAINSINGNKGSKTDYKKDIPAERIKSIMNEVSSGQCASLEIDKVFHSSRFNLKKLKEIELIMVDESVLLRIMEILDESSDLINEYLTISRSNVS